LKTISRNSADPRVTDKNLANDLIEQTPAAVWLGYAVHGNKISSTDAAMMTASPIGLTG